jgi:hypothetical protein
MSAHASCRTTVHSSIDRGAEELLIRSSFSTATSSMSGQICMSGIEMECKGGAGRRVRGHVLRSVCLSVCEATQSTRNDFRGNSTNCGNLS